MTFITQKQLQENKTIECYLLYNMCNDNGEYFGFTSHDSSVQAIIDGSTITFAPGMLSRGNVRQTTTGRDSEVDVAVAADSDEMADVIQQNVENLVIRIIHIIADQDNDGVYGVDDYITIFWGESAESERSHNVIRVRFNTFESRLTAKVPRVLFQKSCQWQLYDCNTCRAVREDHTFPAQIVQITNSRYTVDIDFAGDISNEPDVISEDISSGALIADAYTGGIIKFSSGQECSIHSDDIIGSNHRRRLTLLTRAPLLASPNQRVEVSFGCSFTFNGENGCSKFLDPDTSKKGNWKNFGGHPYIQPRDIVTDDLS